ANQRGLHFVDPRIERHDVEAAKLLREDLLEPRIEETPERQAASDEILPEPALRLVDTERIVLADRKMGDLAWQLVCVEPVPVLVHRREQGLQMVRVVVRGDAYVVDPGAGCEWMFRRVVAPGVRPM